MRQLNVHKLVKNLNELCDVLVDKYCINYGGCCYVAYEIAKHLDRLGIKYDLCILNDFHLDEEEINQEVRSKNRNYGIDSVSGDNTCCHYYIMIEGGGPVNRGNLCSKYYTYKVTRINHRNLNWLYRTSCWNSDYKTKNNKFVKKSISLHFKQYGKARKTSLCSCEADSVSAMQVRG